MNQNLFTAKDPNQAFQVADQNFVRNIKASHFDFAHNHNQTPTQTAGHFLSETAQKYNQKGSAILLRAQIDNKRKNDLRKNHFEIGGPTARFKESVKNLAFRPGTA